MPWDTATVLRVWVAKEEELEGDTDLPDADLEDEGDWNLSSHHDLSSHHESPFDRTFNLLLSEEPISIESEREYRRVLLEAIDLTEAEMTASPDDLTAPDDLTGLSPELDMHVPECGCVGDTRERCAELARQYVALRRQVCARAREEIGEMIDSMNEMRE